jgi:hypothetical protein
MEVRKEGVSYKTKSLVYVWFWLGDGIKSFSSEQVRSPPSRTYCVVVGGNVEVHR